MINGLFSDERKTGDCDGCEAVAKGTNTDLEGLGIAVLNCMEGTLTDLTAARVRECRASNKVFGLSKPEKWSEHKQLVDFVDDIFSAQRKPDAKFMKPVRLLKQPLNQVADCDKHAYVTRGSWASEALVPLAELASLECFTLWHAI